MQRISLLLSIQLVLVSLAGASPIFWDLLGKPEPVDPKICARLDETYSAMAYSYNALWQAESYAARAALSNVPAPEEEKQALLMLDQAIELKQQADELVPAETDPDRKRYLRILLASLDKSLEGLKSHFEKGIPKHFRTIDIRAKKLALLDLPFNYYYAIVMAQSWEGEIWKIRNDFMTEYCPVIGDGSEK